MTMGSSTCETANHPSTQKPKQLSSSGRGITRSDIRIPSPHLHWDLSSSDGDASEKNQAVSINENTKLCDSNMPASDPVSTALMTIAEHPSSSAQEEMSPTQQRRCCSNCSKDQAICSEHPDSSQRWECYSSSSVIEEAYGQDDSADQDGKHCLGQSQQQCHNQLANDILDHPLLCSTAVHQVSRNTNALHTSTGYDPKHRSQQAIICSPDSPGSLYSPHAIAPGVYGVGGETPELDKHNATFDHGPNACTNDSNKKDHLGNHVRFKFDSSSAENLSNDSGKDGESSASSELIEPTKFDPKASMEIPITLDFRTDPQRTQGGPPEEKQGTPAAAGRRPGLLPSALPDTFNSQNSTTCRKRSTTGPPAPPKDKLPLNLGQSPSPPDSLQAYDCMDNPNLSSNRYNRRNEEYTVFPPRWQSLPFEQRRAITGLACNIQDNGVGNKGNRARSQSNGAQHERDAYRRTHRQDAGVTMAPARPVLDSNGNLCSPFPRTSGNRPDGSAKQGIPFESPRPPPLPPLRTETRHTTPQTPNHTHSRSEGSGLQDIQTPAQFSTPWRPQFDFALFDNSMSPATPSNDLHLQIQRMQKQLKMQQMQLEQLQAAGVEVSLVSPKSLANEQKGPNGQQQMPKENDEDSRMDNAGYSSAQQPTDNKQEIPCRSGRAGSTSRLRSLSPSKIRIRRKQSPPKLQNPGSKPLNVVLEKSTSETELSIDANLANYGRTSPPKSSASDNVNSASHSSPFRSLNDRHSPMTPAFNSYMAAKTQKAAALRSFSTPQNCKRWTNDAADEKITATPRRGSDKDAQQNKTPRGSSIRGWGSKIMKSMQDLTEGRKPPVPNIPTNPFQSRLSPYGPTRTPVSLDPPTQARLYADLDLMICIAANQFLIQQHKACRVSADIFNKLLSGWASKGRPAVPQFMFDQLTQQSLINEHIRAFKFHGECARSPTTLTNTLNAWKALADEMTTRTYFLPDSTVRKHLNDTIKVLEMLGATPQTFLSYQEIQMGALRIMKKAQERKIEDGPDELGPDFIILDDEDGK